MGKLTFYDFVRTHWIPLPPVVNADLTGQTVLVTGANIGLGLECAKHFARMKPARLVIACRSKSKGEEALQEIRDTTGYPNPELRLLDLARVDSVVEFANSFEKERLDIVVCNAAIATFGYDASPEGTEVMLQVNHISTSLLSLLLLPRLMHTARTYSARPRLVFVSSSMHFWSKIPEDALTTSNVVETLASNEYCTSKGPRGRYPLTKLFNVFFARELAARLPPASPLIVSSVDPGYCKSALRRGASGMQSWVFWLMEVALGRTCEQGARNYVWAALGGGDEVKGAYVSECGIMEPSDYVISTEGAAAQRKLFDDTVSTLEKKEPRVRSIVEEYLTKA